MTAEAAPNSPRAVRASLVRESPAPAENAPAQAADEPLSAAPLPLAQVQVQRPQSKTQRKDQVPPPPAPGGREGAAGRPAQARPPADAAQQQIQIDRNGLITMHVNELEVRQLLEFLSRRSGMNILVSPRVSGTVTANFEGLTLDRVLPAIIKLANLVEKREGPIHYIYAKQDLQDQAEELKREKILTKVYKLNYVRADELLSIIRPFLSTDVGRNRVSVTPSYRFGISESNTFVAGGGQAMTAGGGGGGGGAMSGGPGAAPVAGSGATVGGFQPPTGANSLADSDQIIIQDYESNLKIIDQIIMRLDVRPIQVLIEAVIISVDLEHDKELGVNFAVVDNLAQMLGTVGTGTALNGNVGFTPTQLLTAAGKIAQGTPADPQGFTSATNGIKFGFVSTNVTGFVRALETVGSTKILASPRILVLNKQRAEIQLGARLGFQTLSQNFTSTIQQVQFLNVGTLLRIRPFVSADGMVRMEIHPERSSGEVVNNVPSATTAELTTNVMVPDGATLVIGGLMEDEDDFQSQGLPGLSKVPVLGYLFGNRVKNEGRRELVVLLTPHIWSPDLAMAHAPVPPLREDGAGPAPAPMALPPGNSPCAETPQNPGSNTNANAARPPQDGVPFGNTGATARAMPVQPPAAQMPVGAATRDEAVSRTRWQPDSVSRLSRDGSPDHIPSTAETAARGSHSRARPERSASRPRRHTVEPGESFARIAMRYYGSARYEQALWWANRGRVAWPERLAAGDVIVIPSARELDALVIPSARGR